jgi:pimeloyl-ACP methyl ester carboxylesterase
LYKTKLSIPSWSLLLLTFQKKILSLHKIIKKLMIFRRIVIIHKFNKMKKKSVFIIVVLLIIFYQIPAKQAAFFKTYPKDDYAAKSLKEFYNKEVKYISVNDVKWKYLTSGNSDKVILLLHGMGGAYDLWWQQVDFFDKDYKIITYTLPEDIDNLDDALIGIKAILKKENVGNFTAVGTSMGGYIAQYILKQMPERLDKMVFSNTFPPNEEILKENKTKSKIIPYLPEIIISWFGKKSIEKKLLPSAHNDTLLKAFLPSLPFSKKSFINRFYVVVDKFMINPSSYKYKRVPKLIIESDNDPLVSEKLRKELKELYPDAKVFTFHNEGHFPYINASKQYNQILSQFINEKNNTRKIENVVHNYFTGRKNVDIDILKKVFDNRSKLMYSDKDSIYYISFNKYLKKVTSDGKKQIQTQILDFDVQNNMAYIKTEFKYNNRTYVDYLTLLKKSEDWKIISKTFTRTLK